MQTFEQVTKADPSHMFIDKWIAEWGPALKEKLPQMVCDIAWLVEGRHVQQLPEGTIGSMRFIKMNPDNAVEAATFFRP